MDLVRDKGDFLDLMPGCGHVQVLLCEGQEKRVEERTATVSPASPSSSSTMSYVSQPMLPLGSLLYSVCIQPC